MKARVIAPLILIPLAFAFWISVPWLTGSLTGWKRLAKSHSFEGNLPLSNKWTHCSVPNLTLRNFLTVALDENGMYFEMPFWFRVGNPPLFFPWDQIRVEERMLLFQNTIRVGFRDSEISFHFYPEQAGKFKNAAGALWPGR